ncbi:hypothetical protein VP01_1283g9 [Puccinia sorghi]|uniref:Tc1-like transposase DDE domain-containing protein n=1 Tax=Puccinia sorghi TaxID=27349 RepID=A0A0L6VQ67_9BASI|nr:hypothetical protein VP01_1283g9 [Puccinia sorghi]
MFVVLNTFLLKHLCVVHAAALKTNTKDSLINLIDGNKKTGPTANHICNFLLHLQDHCPPGSIIIMDNTPIHGGDDFEHVQLLIKESAKNLEMEFLPRYSLFKLTPKICQKGFLHCQKGFLHFHKIYPTCTYMQPITENVIKDPENFFQVPQFS